MLLLAFDTATPAVTVAVHDGTRTLASSCTVDAHRHAELLAPAIADVLAEAGAGKSDLTAVAAGVGPGPYTGLRVGVVTARVLASTLGIPGYGLCTLDAIAAGVEQDGEYLVATDARRREVYWARYKDGTRVSGPDVSKPADVPGRDLPVAGAGADMYPDAFPVRIFPKYPAAGSLAGVVAAELPGGGMLLPLDPLYLRRPDAKEPGARKSVLRS